jgi:AraC family transcriptional regulator, activator of mtrCDE
VARALPSQEIRKTSQIFREFAVDALTALANGLNLRAKLVYAGGACGEWVMDHNSDRSIWFHLIAKGEGFVHSSAFAEPLRLEEGDMILFLPQAAEHFISYSPAHLPRDGSATRIAAMADGDAGFVCGEIRLQAPQSLLWQSLPNEIILRRHAVADDLHRLIAMVIGEAVAGRFGNEAVIERLCDSFFILVLRRLIETGEITKGIFVAMTDRRLATVLRLIHTEPWTDWSIAELCARAGISKSALAERFSSEIGMSPIEYLTHWRMQIAACRLSETGITLDRLAEHCGYESAASFSRAFKRTFGLSPAAFRKKQANGAA